jgi:hypothetical protein
MPSSDARRADVLTVERPGDDDFAAAMGDRSCTACGRTQTELAREGHSLRFLCPDDVCTSCLGEAAA